MEYTIRMSLQFNGKNYVEDNTIRFYFSDHCIEVTPKDSWEFDYFSNCLELFCGCDNYRKAKLHLITNNGEERFYALVENELPLCEIGKTAFDTLFEIEE